MTEGATMPAATTTAHCEAVLDEIERVVVGKRAALRLILTAVLARGHVLIEDLPGLGKTLIARSFAAALGLPYAFASHFAPASHSRHRLQVASQPVAHADPGGTGLFSSVTTALFVLA